MDVFLLRVGEPGSDFCDPSFSKFLGVYPTLDKARESAGHYIEENDKEWDEIDHMRWVSDDRYDVLSIHHFTSVR
jgi:hypothetical protein